MKLKTFCITIALITVFLLYGQVYAGAIGEPLPDFELTTTEGKTVKGAELKGKKPVFLVFWATWCPSCKKEIPVLNKLFAKYKNRDIEFIGVDVGMNDTQKRMIKFAEKYDMKYPVAFDKDSVLTKKLHLQGIPTVIITDTSGIIRYRDHSPPKSLEVYFTETKP